MLSCVFNLSLCAYPKKANLKNPLSDTQQAIRMIETSERITALNRFINSERFLHYNLIQRLKVLFVFHK